MRGWHNRAAGGPECATVTMWLVTLEAPMSE